ncbi:hypothetical protein ACIA8O_00670 [Kitasatospora sp. NPDC051853]|uniref:hypothetical protein n=1 Tax=Kitasatospora sp. NPDC051853 TaxID=3364058 RepID=UPI0037914CBF
MPSAQHPDQPSADNRINGGTFGTAVQAARIGAVTIHHSPGRPPLPVPRQLPRRPEPFIGRGGDLARLAAHFDAGNPVVVVYGPPGSGKSRLAAEALTGHGGPQLYADLRQAGATDGPDHLLLVLAGWLRALGHPGPWANRAEAAAWWRTVTATEPPPAVLLDHADATPLGVLMPAAGPVVVTSLAPLPDLAADGARHHGLAGLQPADARALLRHRANPRRLEGQDANRLVAACHHLPAPIGLLGARLALDPHLPPAALLIPLANRRTRRSSPTEPEPSIMATTLAAAARELPNDLAAALRTAAALPFPEIEPHLLAAALSITPDDATDRMNALADRFLLTRTPTDRFTLVGSGEGTVLAGQDTDVLLDRVRRAVVWWLAALTAAERVLTPTHRVLERESAPPGEAPITLAFADAEPAWEWLSAQTPLVRPVLAACAGRWPALTWQITHALWPLWHRQRDQELRLWALDLALPAVKATGSPLAIREIHSTRAGALRDVHRYDEALREAEQALALARQDRDLRGQGQYTHEIGATLHAAGHPAEALPHLFEALSLREQDRYVRGIALTRLMIGACQLDLGNREAARIHLTAAHRLLADIGDTLDAARALAYLGRVLLQLGLAGDALAAYERAAADFELLGARVWLARTTFWSAAALDALGRGEEATAALRRARLLYGGTHADDVASIDAALATRP